MDDAAHDLIILQTFSPNPYFEDTKLTKAFSFFDDGTTNITGTRIRWKEGKVSGLPAVVDFWI